MIKLLENIEYEPILNEYYKLEPNIVWQDSMHKGKQSGLQYLLGKDPWLSAVGKFQGISELEYNILNPFYKNSIFERIINTYQLTRTRLMWLGANACYSFHKDTTPRIHIPLITNDQCFLIFKNFNIINMSLGGVYWIDTRNEHTAINGSDKWRLHLVGVVEK